MLKLKNITTIEKNPSLKNLNLNIAKGSFVLLAYKSTVEKNKIIDLICQVESPRNGGIFINGKDITNSKTKITTIHKQIGIAFSDFKFLSTKTVLGNVIFPLEVYSNLSKKKILETGEVSLKAFGLLDKKDLPVSHLTLEEKQRLNIARSIINNPELIILDNPEQHLKKAELDGFLKFFQDLTKKDKTIIIMSNDNHISKKITQNKYLLEKGAVSNV